MKRRTLFALAFAPFALIGCESTVARNRKDKKKRPMAQELRDVRRQRY